MSNRTRDARRPEAPDWGVKYDVSELWSEVLPGLFIGGTADDDTIAYPTNYEIERGGQRFPTDVDSVLITTDDFDAVVTMYAYARPVSWGVEELRYGIMDARDPSLLDSAKLLETVRWAERRWSTTNGRVLIRCQAGLNRSSLIAALVMIRSGLSPAFALETIREERSLHALFNRTFERFVIQADVDYWRS